MFKCKSCGNSDGMLHKKFSSTKAISIKASGSSRLSTNLWACKNCDLISQYPEHSQNYIENLYKNESDFDFVENNDFRIKTFERAILKLFRLKILFPCQNGLDIGCAGGSFPVAARNLNLNVTGVEPSKYLSRFAKNNYGINVYNGYLAEVIDRLPSKFDFVTLWDVLEHIYELNETLDLIGKLIENEGKLIINVPSLDSLPAQIMRSAWPMFLDVHLHYFKKSSLEALLKRHNFELLYTFNYYQILPLGYVLKRGLQHILNCRLNSPIFNIKIPFNYYIGQKCYVFERKT